MNKRGAKVKFLHSKLSQNTFILLLSNGGSAILSFLLSVLIGRTLGETGLGVYAAALAWIFPLSLITEFGLGTLITRDLAHAPEITSNYVQSAIKVRIIIGAILILILWLLAPFLSNDFAVIQGLRLSSPMIVLVPLYGTFTAVFRARQIMRPIAYLNLGMLIAQVIVTAGVFLAGGGIYGAISVNVLTSAGQVIAAWSIYRRDFVEKTKTQNYTISLFDLLKRAWPFAIAALLGAMQLRLNFIFLERFTTTQIVGQYAAASRFVEAGAMLPAALFGALFPALSELRDNQQKLKRLMRIIQMGLLTYGVCFGLGLLLFASPIIHLTYGANFTASVLILQVLAWSLLPGVLKSSLILYWYARGYESTVNIITAIGLTVQFALSLWLIPAYGAVGAAIVIIITECVAFMLLSAIHVIFRKDKS